MKTFTRKIDIDKRILVILFTIVASLAAYSYLAFHNTVGIDDTELSRYVCGGWEPQVNRWGTYVIGKLINISDANFMPGLYEIAGAMFLVAAALIFDVLFDKVLGGGVPVWGYLLFNGLLVTGAFMEEVMIFYLHNAVCLAFFFVAESLLSLYYFYEKKHWWRLVLSIVCLSFSVGCYESFITVYLTGICLILLARAYNMQKSGCLTVIIASIVSVFAAIFLRSLWQNILVKAYALNLSELGTNVHGISLKYWFLNNPFMILKDMLVRFFIRYVVNAVYLPQIMVFLITLICFIGFTIYGSVRNKNLMITLWSVGFIICPWLLSVPEMDPNSYRICQGIMLFIAGTWFLIYLWSGKKMRVVISVVALCCILAQLYELNRYFYNDHLKYKSDVEYCEALYEDISHSVSDMDKSVILIGKYEMPQKIREKNYVEAGTEEYEKLSKFCRLEYVDDFYKYVDEYGYRLYDVSYVDPLSWARYAGLQYENAEIFDFCKIHGIELNHSYSKEEHSRLVREVETEIKEMPVWPEDGAILETDEAVYVKIGRIE
ncbi:MAG: glucosyltransferase domain-containing protein [Acetatifactor sp.]|nr:glucosyltransferase domain-containing protein [Acetatifactor sp.]